MSVFCIRAIAARECRGTLTWALLNAATKKIYLNSQNKLAPQINSNLHAMQLMHSPVRWLIGMPHNHSQCMHAPDNTPTKANNQDPTERPPSLGSGAQYKL